LSGRPLSVIIPSFNGDTLLRRHLPGVVTQARVLPAGAEVVVVDDGSEAGTDATAEVVRSVGAPAWVLRLAANRGFAAACNAGAAAATGQTLFFLNNDIELVPGCLTALARVLGENPSLFGATPVLVNAEDGFAESSICLRFVHGVFDVHFPGREGLAPAGAGELRPVASGCGGALACRREAFEALGGFTELFVPFYWEDIDLGWRARRAGMAIVEVGDALVLHEHARTIGARHSQRQIRTIYERNRLLFTWRHLAGPRAWLAHLAWLPLRLVGGLVRGTPTARALPAALARLGSVVRLRRRDRLTTAQARVLLGQVRRCGHAGWPEQEKK
jgi:GT2 family glycosyltransferase